MMVVLVMILIAMFFDERSRRIPNFITFPGMLLGLLTNSYLNGAQGIRDAIIGIVTPVILLFVFYALRMIGAGDIKLFAAIGAFTGVLFALKIIVMSILCGGIIATVLVIVRKNAVSRIKHMWNYILSIFIMGKISKYQSFSESNDGLFKFSYAILGGFILVNVFSFLNFSN